MLAALGYPIAEVFHPLWGGQINEPSLIAFQATPLQQFWPIVVGAIGLIESASYIVDTENPAETGRYWTFKEDPPRGQHRLRPARLRQGGGPPLRGAHRRPHSYAGHRG